jgi:PAS domain S-box-containing protein
MPDDFSLFEYAPDAMIVVDEAGRIVFANRHLLPLLGTAPEALIGRAVEELIPERFHVAHQVHRMMYATDPGTRPMATGRTFPARRADGREVTVDVSLSPIQSDQRRFFVAALRDVTERVRYQNEAALLGEVGGIAATTMSFDEMMWAAIRVVCRHTPFRHAGWFATDRGGAALESVPRWYRDVATTSDSRQHEPIPPDQDLAFTSGCDAATRVWTSGHAEWITDLGDSTGLAACVPMAAALGVTTALFVPMAEGRARFAVIMLGRTDAASRDDALVGVISTAIGQVAAVFGRRQAELATLDAARLASSVFEYTTEPKLLLNSALIVELANPAFHEAFGTSPGAVVGRPFFDIADGVWDAPELRQSLDAAIDADHHISLTLARQFPAIGTRNLAVNIQRVRREDESGQWVLLAISDRTDTLRLQEQFNRASRLESIGRLASGVAHDFNNLLVPILGSADMMMAKLTTSDPLYRYADMVRKAADRAATLTRQLLAYGRPQEPCVQPTSVRVVLADSRSLIASLIGESITLTIAIDAEVSHALIDRDQISRCLLNLAINAHDAMPDGGMLTIEAVNTTIRHASDEPRSIRPMSPGNYVALSVRDTGQGMDAATRGKLFEPFFSTKGSRGTGLGLSTVDGAIAQMHGNIAVTSEPGRGTTFRLYLPATPEPATAVAESTNTATASSGGSESILLVENDPDVRATVVRILSEAGYTMLNTSSADDATQVSRRHRARIDLLLTDVVMPGLTGHDLAKRLREGRPALRVIYMSGHTGRDIGTPPRGLPVVGAPTISKPFAPAALLELVRRVLDADISDAP